MYQLIAFFLGTLAVFNERLHKQKITCVRACMRAGVVGDGEGGGVNVPSAYRFGQNHIYTVHIRYFWQENNQIYGHIWCIYTVLAHYIAEVYKPAR